ncbi:MAG: hypothetical protein RL693_2430 [Verrucomicrobiota bacterium]|jgi:mRNA interferase YafQ
MKIRQTSQFKKDIKKQKKRGKDLIKLKEVINLLVAGEPLLSSHRDHALTGNWTGWRDCHLEPDWLLIYRLWGDELILGRTGTHADLF